MENMMDRDELSILHHQEQIDAAKREIAEIDQRQAVRARQNSLDNDRILVLRDRMISLLQNSSASEAMTKMLATPEVAAFPTADIEKIRLLLDSDNKAGAIDHALACMMK
jgi:hypothetical protein